MIPVEAFQSSRPRNFSTENVGNNNSRPINRDYFNFFVRFHVILTGVPARCTDYIIILYHIYP